MGEEFGPVCSTGDVMGCGISFPVGMETEKEEGVAAADSGSEFDDSEHDMLYGFEEDEELEDDISYDSEDYEELFERPFHQQWLMRG